MTRKDWLELGLRALAAGGPEALTIEALCTKAERSKGSFYHHFGAIDGYLLALAGYWRERDTEEIIRLSSAPEASAEKLGALNQLTSHLDVGLEQGMRRLAGQMPGVQAICLGVDKRRVGYLIKLHRETGQFDTDEAELLARVTYAAFVGFQVIAPDMPPEMAQAAYLKFMGLLRRKNT